MKNPPSDPAQPLQGFMTNEEWSELLEHVDLLVQEMENLPYPGVKEKVFELLAGVDAIHRESLRRLVRLFKEGVLEQVVTDPAIHTLMELYDLLPPDPKAVDEQRAKILFTRSSKNNKKETFEEQAPRANVYAHWHPVSENSQSIEEGSLIECSVEDLKIIVCRVGDTLFAFDSACVRDGASLAGSTLQKYNLCCSEHEGCYYDIRQGAQIGGTSKLQCYPVRSDDDGRILIGIGMSFTPNLPSF